MKKTIILLMIITSYLFALEEERDLKIKQAANLNSRKLYHQANDIYREILGTDPADYEVSERLINNFLIMTLPEKADSVLEISRNYFPELDYTKNRIHIDLSLRKIEEAFVLAEKYLQKNPGKINDYRILATAFERYREYESAATIHLKAREASKDEFLYSRELAFDYERMENWPEAVREYLKHLDYNSGFFNYIYSRLKNILHDHPENISVVEAYTGKTANPIIQELYALSLGEMGRFEDALLVYSTLDPAKLADFAERQYKNGNLEVALTAYQNYIDQIKDTSEKAEIRIEIALIDLELGRLEAAKEILNDIYNDKELEKNKYRFKSSAARRCREILAEIAVIENAGLEIVLKYLEEAKSFSFNNKNREDIEYKIIHYNIMNGILDESSQRLDELIRKAEEGTDTYKMGSYYYYLLALMENSADTDSLLGEVILNIPENARTNDALYLYILTGNLKDQNKAQFILAFRKKQLFQDLEAAEILTEIFQGTGDEKIYILAADWYYQAGYIEEARAVFDYDFEDITLQEYAYLQKSRLEKVGETRTSMITGFLSEKPHSVFSPEFRQMMGE